MTNLVRSQPRRSVNLEVDVIAKYVEKMIAPEKGAVVDYDRQTGARRFLKRPEMWKYRFLAPVYLLSSGHSQTIWLLFSRAWHYSAPPRPRRLARKSRVDFHLDNA